MQKLKVYLKKQETSSKTVNQKIKERKLASKSYMHGLSYEPHQQNAFHGVRNTTKNKSGENKNREMLSQGNKKYLNNQTHKNYHSHSAINANQTNNLLRYKDGHNKSQSSSSHHNLSHNERNKNKTITKAPSLYRVLEIPIINSQKKREHRNENIQELKTRKNIQNSEQNPSFINSKSLNTRKDAIKKSKKQLNIEVDQQRKAKKKRSKSAAIKPAEITDSHKNINNISSKVLPEAIKRKPNRSHNQSILSNQPPCQNVLQFNSMFRTRKGVQAMNPNKVNQDRYLISQNNIIQIKNHTNFTYQLYAVADGHGACGHHVSNIIIENLHKRIDHHLNTGFSKQYNQPSYHNKANEKDKKNNMKKNEHNIIAKSLHRSYNDLQQLLDRNPEEYAEFSGSTLVTLLIETIQNNSQPMQKNRYRITCANVGDSRAIVARQISKQNWQIIRLSDDHKPSRQTERKRIINCGGRVQKIRDERGFFVGPLRVWLPKKQMQGLAMTRSLGDNISKPVGVTHEPEILSHELDGHDKFIIVASDGVWEFLTNYQILTLLIPYYRQNKLEQGCEALLRASYNSWTTQQNTIVDDITFIIIFINQQQKPNVTIKQIAFKDLDLSEQINLDPQANLNNKL